MYVFSWQTVSVLTRVLFWFLFPSLLRNSGNKHQNNPLVSAETVRHSSTYIILYEDMWNGDELYNPSTLHMSLGLFLQKAGHTFYLVSIVVLDGPAK